MSSKNLKTRFFKYSLYEQAVQTPEQHCDMFALMYADIFGKSASILREDFCGTYHISSAWVKRGPKNRAIGLDLDPEPIEYGRIRNATYLTAAEKKRISIYKQNVLSTTSVKSDLTVACNFSFYIFKERKTLVEYFRNVLNSMKKEGIFILEMTGGPGMIEPIKETRTIDSEYPKNMKGSVIPKAPRKFKYIWHQKSFNPITREGLYAIHFKLNNGKQIKDAFQYDWRIWTMPEVRDALEEAGFTSTYVYWDMGRARKGITLGGHEYGRTEKGDNHYSWISYVMGVKK